MCVRVGSLLELCSGVLGGNIVSRSCFGVCVCVWCVCMCGVCVCVCVCARVCVALDSGLSVCIS